MATTLRLARLLCREDILTRFRGNVLGLLWVLITPLVQVAILYLVFGRILGARVPGMEEGGYVAFLALGMWPWFAFADGVSRGASSMSGTAGLRRKVAIPPEAPVLGKVMAAFGLHGFGFLLLLALMFAFGIVSHLHGLPWMLAAWAIAFALSFLFALAAAMLQVFVQDLRHGVEHLLTLGFFLTPIIYSAQMLSPAGQAWIALNPFTAIVGVNRTPLIGGDVGLDTLLVPGLFAAALVLVVGFLAWRLLPRIEEYE